MELHGELLGIQRKIKQNKQDLEGLKRREIVEEQEEELYRLVGLGNKLNEEMHYYFRGMKASRFLDATYQELMEYRSSMRIYFDNLYQEINSRNNELYSEQEFLRESYQQVKEKLKKIEAEK